MCLAILQRFLKNNRNTTTSNRPELDDDLPNLSRHPRVPGVQTALRSPDTRPNSPTSLPSNEGSGRQGESLPPLTMQPTVPNPNEWRHTDARGQSAMDERAGPTVQKLQDQGTVQTIVPAPVLELSGGKGEEEGKEVVMPVMPSPGSKSRWSVSSVEEGEEEVAEDVVPVEENKAKEGGRELSDRDMLPSQRERRELARP